MTLQEQIRRAQVEAAERMVVDSLPPELRFDSGRAAASLVQQAELSDEEIEGIAHRRAWRYKQGTHTTIGDEYTFNRFTLLDFSRSLLSARRGGEAMPGGADSSSRGQT